jgi:hypothetical protein
MAITGNASYIPTMNEFIAHWAQCNTALAPAALLVRLPDNTTKTQAQFVTLRDLLQTQQNTVQSCLTVQQIARGNIFLKKIELLSWFNMFTSLLDGYYQNTDFYAARPYAPVLTAGQEAFTRPMVGRDQSLGEDQCGAGAGGNELAAGVGRWNRAGDFRERGVVAAI